MNKRGQIWVETAIYILIGLTIMGILLAIITPQVEKAKDRGVITQTINALEILDGKIIESEQSPGNIRIVDFKIAKGELELNSQGDYIRYSLKGTKLELSQIGKEISQGNTFIRTEKEGSRFDIFLTRYYNESVNITYKGREETKIMPAGGVAYKIQIENIGDNDPANPNEKVHIDFSIS